MHDTIIRVRISIISLLLLLGSSCMAQADGDDIVGKWKAVEKTLTIEIYKHGDEYRARIVDFTDHHSSIPAWERKDEKNPQPQLRSRRLIGIDVLSGLHFDKAERAWTDGHVYDVSSGREYSAELHLDPGGELSVRAYRGVTFLGKTLRFVRK